MPSSPSSGCSADMSSLSSSAACQPTGTTIRGPNLAHQPRHTPCRVSAGVHDQHLDVVQLVELAGGQGRDQGAGMADAHALGAHGKDGVDLALRGFVMRRVVGGRRACRGCPCR